MATEKGTGKTYCMLYEEKKGGEALMAETDKGQKRGGAKPWKRFKGTCNSCGKQGHKKADCWDEKRSAQGEDSAKKGGSNSDNKNKKDKRMCFKCHEHGHIVKDCPTKKGGNLIFVGCVEIDESKPCDWDAEKARNRQAWQEMRSVEPIDEKVHGKHFTDSNRGDDETDAQSEGEVYATSEVQMSLYWEAERASNRQAWLEMKSVEPIEEKAHSKHFTDLSRGDEVSDVEEGEVITTSEVQTSLYLRKADDVDSEDCGSKPDMRERN